MTTVLPMIKNKKWTEADVVSHCIGERSVRDAADWFNENLPEQFKVSHGSVQNWVTGTNDMSHLFMNSLIVFYSEGDERRVMAEDISRMRLDAVRAHWVGESAAVSRERLAVSKKQSEAK